MTGTEQQKNKENVAAIMRAKQIAGKYEFGRWGHGSLGFG